MIIQYSIFDLLQKGSKPKLNFFTKIDHRSVNQLKHSLKKTLPASKKYFGFEPYIFDVFKGLVKSF